MSRDIYATTEIKEPKTTNYAGEVVAAASQNIKEKEYWLNTLAGDLEKAYFPLDHKKKSKDNSMDTLQFDITGDTFSKLMNLCNWSDFMLHMFLLSVTTALLKRYTNSKDIIIGTPIYKQRVEGKFINTILPLRNKIEPGMTFKELLMQVRQTLINATENQNYPIETLLYKLNLEHLEDDEFPLFDLAVLLENIHDRKYIQHINLNMILSFTRGDSEITGTFAHNPSLYDRTTILRVISHFSNFIHQTLLNIDSRLESIDIFSEQEKRQILVEFNDTEVEYPTAGILPGLYEEQVVPLASKLSVIYEDEQLTHDELNKRANQLARVLRRKGVKANGIVGIMVERSLEMIIGMMGILKAGGAYLPINSTYPAERIKFMLEDSSVKLLLTKSHFECQVGNQVEKINLEEKNQFLPGESSNLNQITKPVDMAYIIYTSGSTGKQKGVVIEHQSILNTLLWRKDYYGFDQHDAILQIPSFSFDSSVEDIFTPLISGAQLTLINEENRYNIDYLGKLIKKRGITHFLMVPSFYKIFLEEDPASLINMKSITIAGDNFSENLVMEHSRKLSHVKLINEYGPTESSVCATVYEFTPGKTGILIGKPISNVKCYILDEDGQPCPIGVSGELCISGAGLAREYLNNPKLTGKKFVKHRFIEGQRLYRTGDLARWCKSGDIEFLGRTDHQLKIRGFRIEPGEIESRLLNYKNIKNAVVIAKEDENGDKYLCAYIVSPQEYETLELQDYLSRDLPNHMIPANFVFLDRIPLSVNGKIDRKSLPEPTIKKEKNYAPPTNKIEEKMVDIWAEVLGQEKTLIGIDSNFFDLGGHSLKATILASKIHKACNVKIPMVELFKSPTIREISLYITAQKKDRFFSLRKAEAKKYYVLSAAQKRLYILQQLEIKSKNYNVPFLFALEGQLDRQRLEGVFHKLIQRHESLRTSFQLVQGEPVQKIHQHVEFQVRYQDLADKNKDRHTGDGKETGTDREQKIKVKTRVEDFVSPFDLSRAPLLRVEIIKTSENQNILMMDMHHIATDGVSMEILINEMLTLYKGEELPGLTYQYKDYSEWQNTKSEEEKRARQKAYWLKQLEGEIPVLNLPTDYPRPEIQSFAGNLLSFEIGGEATRRLKEIASEQGATLYMIFLAIINVFLSKITGQEDIIIGSPVAGRRHENLEPIIGMFVNTLAMRNFPAQKKTFKEFLREIKKQALKAYENQEYQFEDLVEAVNVNRDASRNPVFDVLFVLQNMDRAELKIPGLKLKEYDIQHKTSKFDISYFVWEDGDRIRFQLEYCTKLFKQETIQRWARHFQQIIEVVTGHPDIPLGDIEITTQKEKEEILTLSRGVNQAFDVNETIHHWFEKKAASLKDKTALVFNGQTLTYGELNKKANQLAGVLRAKGVQADTLVGLMVHRSFSMIIGIIAILKAGGAYLPLEPYSPVERKRVIFEDSGVKLLLTDTDGIPGTEAFSNDLQIININDTKGYAGDSANLPPINDGFNLVYVIYTSGSTGKPKGVMLQHRGLINILLALYNKYPFSERDTYLLKTSYLFDVSVTELFGWFLGGGRLVIMEKEGEKDPHMILDTIKRSHVTHINFVPSMFHAFMSILNHQNISELSSLKNIFLAGEAIGKELVRMFNALNTNVVLENLYGPTEATIYASWYSLRHWNGNHRIPIGKPLDNVKLYILNKHGHLQPIGIPGELVISGISVARGYLNRPEQTRDKFISNAVLKGELLYHTGDLARWLMDGSIEFLGRIDHQVKIRGFRIEPGEIESHLMDIDFIKETVVIARQERNKDKYLCAYLVGDHHREIDVSELRNELLKRLPNYMVPSYFITLDRIPLTPNGKVDRKALPQPRGGMTPGKSLAPRTEIEKQLVNTWSRVLEIDEENIGVDGNFFELGGHSLKAISLISRIHMEFDVKVPLAEVFRTPTVLGLAKYINQTRKISYVSIKPGEKKEAYPLSSAQKRLHVLQQMVPNTTAYNLPEIVELEGQLEKDKLEDAFVRLIKRHESLRTSLEMIDGEVVQRIHENTDFTVDYYDLAAGESTAGRSVIESITNTFVKPFDLSQAPLLRVGLIKTGKNKHILMADMHHIISDGVSLNILVKDFILLYARSRLPSLALQYRDFSTWQNQLFESGEMKKQEKYWLNCFKGELPVLEMPTDFPRPPLKSFEGDRINFEIDREFTGKLRKLVSETGTTLYIVLLAAVNVLLAKYSGQEDIIVGSGTAGRTHESLQDIIGMFVNMLAMRNFPKENLRFVDFLAGVKITALNAFENQDFQFEELVHKMGLEGHPGRNSLFDVVFAFQTLKRQAKEIPGLKLKSYQYKHNISKFDLVFNITDRDDFLDGELAYSTELFKRSTVQKILKYFIEVMNQVVENKKIKLKEITISHDLVIAKSENPQVDFEF